MANNESIIKKIDIAMNEMLDLLRDKEFLFTRGNPQQLINTYEKLGGIKSIMLTDDTANEPFEDDLATKIDDVVNSLKYEIDDETGEVIYVES